MSRVKLCRLFLPEAEDLLGLLVWGMELFVLWLLQGVGHLPKKGAFGERGAKGSKREMFSLLPS